MVLGETAQLAVIVAKKISWERVRSRTIDGTSAVLVPDRLPAGQSYQRVAANKMAPAWLPRRARFQEWRIGPPGSQKRA